MTEVRTRDEAIASVDHALQAWLENVAVILTSAHNAARAAKQEAEGIVRKRANEVAATEALLAAASEERRRGLLARLARAKEAHEQARRAHVRASDVAAGVAQLARAHTQAATPQVATARVQLSAMSRALEAYRRGGGGFRR